MYHGLPRRYSGDSNQGKYRKQSSHNKDVDMPKIEQEDGLEMFICPPCRAKNSVTPILSI